MLHGWQMCLYTFGSLLGDMATIPYDRGYGCIWDYVLQIKICVHQLKHRSYITHHMGVSEDRVPPQIPWFITIFPHHMDFF